MTTLRQRSPRVRDAAFLAFLRTKCCCVCGRFHGVQAAHIRMSSAQHGATNPGVGAKPSDHLAVPLCAGCHMSDNDSQHRVGERQFWERVRLDPFATAQNLYTEFQQRKSS